MAESRIDELRRRIERDPGSRLFAQLAEELRKEGEVAEAITVARAGLERHPAYPSARLTLGRALLDSGDPAAARVELEAAVKGAPDNILASRLLGEALETLGDLGAALLQYRATLQLAPGDGHVEARVRAVQERLGGPAPAPRETTEPMATPGSVAAQGAAEGELPPTIRIRMPGDPPAPARAPLPPPARPPADPVFAEGVPAEEATAPPGDRRSVGDTTVPRPLVEAPGPAAGHPLPPTERIPPPPEPPSSEVPPEEPPSAERSPTAGKSLPPTEKMPPPPEPAREALPADDAVAPVAAAKEKGTAQRGPDADLAPTIPKSKAAEYAALDEPEGLPPTLPPGVITGVEETPSEAPSPSEAGGQEVGQVSEDASSDDLHPTAPEGAAAHGDGGEAAQAPQLPPAGDAPAGPGDSPADGATARQAPLSSGTLAELYFQQGLLERAVEVYRQVLEEEPGNERARERVQEIEALVQASAAELPAPPEDGEFDPATRRRALERAIERLEALLLVVRRR